MNIAVIGAGASGLLAALKAVEQGASVSLFERNASLGRKLLVTGSGRCNLTNDHVSKNPYTCDDPAWTKAILDRYGVEKFVDTFQELGIPTYKTWDGWYYPISNSAHSVVNAMTFAVESSRIAINRSSMVTKVTKNKHPGYRVYFTQNNNKQIEDFERVIISTGGKAYPTLGSKGEMFQVLEELGHTIIPIRPALAPVLADLGDLKSLQGVRLDLGTILYQGEKHLASGAGNMIFTEWGLNGPAVMDVSHHIPDPAGDSLYISLNLLHFIEEPFNRLLKQNRHSAFTISLLLSAFFPPKVVNTITNMVGIPDNRTLASLDASLISRLKSLLKDIRLKVQGVRGYKYCQASTGGVPVKEVDPSTLESKINQGLYLTGEVLNVVGPCGGYNLHFAFSSGALAGLAAGRMPDFEHGK